MKAINDVGNSIDGLELVSKFESVLTAWYKRFKLHIHSHRNIRYIAYKFLIVYLLYMLRNINWPEKLSFRDITALSLSHLSIFFLAYSIMSCYIVNLLAVFEFFHLLINVVCEWRYVATGKWSHDPIKKSWFWMRALPLWLPFTITTVFSGGTNNIPKKIQVILIISQHTYIYAYPQLLLSTTTLDYLYNRYSLIQQTI